MFSICLFISFLGVGANARAVPFIYRNASTSASPMRIDTACHAHPITISPSIVSEEAIILEVSSDRYLAATSTDDDGPAKLQSASYIAQPSGALTTLATSISGVPAEPQSDSVFGGIPSAPVPVLRSERSANVTASLLSSRLAAGTSELPPAATLTITHSTFRLGHFVAVNQTVSEPTRIPSIATTKTMSDPQTTEEPQNALSVLLSALPSDLASSIQAGYSIVTHNFLATSETETSRPTSRPTPTDRSREPILSTSRSEPRPTSNHTPRPTDQTRTSRPTSHSTIPRSSSHTARPTSHRPPRPSSRPTSSTLSTFTTSTRPTSTTSTSTSTPPPPPSTTTEAENNSQPSITPERQQANGTIAGVATGAAAGVVLITLAIFFFLRRRQRKRALQAVVAKSSQPYPEVAWLYDPVRSPPRSLSPAPQPGAGGELGMMKAQAHRNSLLAPEVVIAPEGEPLLAPGRAATRDNSPSGGVRSASPSGR